MKPSNVVTCPNCKGRRSNHWPFGPCTICAGTGRTTRQKADRVIAQRRREQEGAA